MKKDTNPKDAVGITKTPLSTLPWRVLWRVGLAMLEGSLKYRRHNYRVAGVRASIYFDSVVSRHMGAWWEGLDVDPDSKLHPIDHAIAGLMILRDGMLTGNWVDDRPPTTTQDMDSEMAALNAHTRWLLEKYPDAKPAYVKGEEVVQDDQEESYLPYVPAPVEVRDPS